MEGHRVGDAEGVPDLVPGVEEAVGVLEAVLELVGVTEGVALGVEEGSMAILRSFPVPKSHTYMTPLGVSKYKP